METNILRSYAEIGKKLEMKVSNKETKIKMGGSQ